MKSKFSINVPWCNSVFTSSSGVGRTGSFAIIKDMVTEWQRNGKLDEDYVTQKLHWIRSRRMESVDNVDQFLWLHEMAQALREGKVKVRPVEEGAYKDLLDWAQCDNNS